MLSLSHGFLEGQWYANAQVLGWDIAYVEFIAIHKRLFESSFLTGTPLSVLQRFPSRFTGDMLDALYGGHNTGDS
jgi:hypothetical protein